MKKEEIKQLTDEQVEEQHYLIMKEIKYLNKKRKWVEKELMKRMKMNHELYEDLKTMNLK